MSLVSMFERVITLTLILDPLLMMDSYTSTHVSSLLRLHLVDLLLSP